MPDTKGFHFLAAERAFAFAAGRLDTISGNTVSSLGPNAPFRTLRKASALILPSTN